MSDPAIGKLHMPKWGFAMTEGRFSAWLAEEGDALEVGDEVAEVETDKINGVVEATAAGSLRRRVARPGDVLPVGALLGVVADPSVPEAEIDAFIARFQATFVPEAEGEARPETETVDVEGRRLRYLREGEGGPPLVLVHGFGGGLDAWLFNQPALAPGRTVYALDLPGHGGSAKDVGAGDLDGFARVVAGFLAALGHDRAHLAGHSLGGAVAMALALAQPERVASLTLIASAGFGPEINAGYVDGFVAATSRRELKPCLELLFADPSLATRQLVDNVLRYKRLDGAQEALAAISAQVFPGGRQSAVLAPALAGSDVPVLVVWGREDRIVPVEHARAAPPHARVEILDGVGHSPHLEAAGQINRLLEEHLGSARA